MSTTIREHISYRPAIEADIPDIERLVLENFPHLMQAMMGNQPDELKLQILIGLRKSRLQPIANVFVATNANGKLIGMVAFDTDETATGFSKGRLAVLKPLGIINMMRFLLTVRFTLIKYTPPPEHAYVRTLAVDKTYRRQGLADDILIYAEQSAKEAGYKKATCFIAGNNSAALNLATKQGYVPTSSRKTFWRGRLLGEPSLVYLEKNL